MSLRFGLAVKHFVRLPNKPCEISHFTESRQPGAGGYANHIICIHTYLVMASSQYRDHTASHAGRLVTGGCTALATPASGAAGAAVTVLGLTGWIVT